MKKLIASIIIVVVTIDRVDSSFISTPPNPFYFTPPEPLVLNWTFTKPYQYRVELYEYLEDWQTWDLIFKSLVWLQRYDYYKYGDRLKFTTEPQSTITYSYSKAEDAGRKRFWLYSYDEAGDYVFQEAFAQFVVKEAQSTSSKIESSTYSALKESPVTYFSYTLKTTNSAIQTSINTSYYPSTKFEEGMSLASSVALYHSSTRFTEETSLTPSYTLYYSNAKFEQETSITPSDSVYYPSTKFKQETSSKLSDTSSSKVSIHSPYTHVPSFFLELRTFSTGVVGTATDFKWLELSSGNKISSVLPSSTLYYMSQLPYEPSSISTDIHQTSLTMHGSNEMTSKSAQACVTTDMSTVSESRVTIDPMLTILEYLSSSNTPSNNTSSRQISSTLTSMQTIHSPVISIIDREHNDSSVLPTSKIPHLINTTRKTSEGSITNTIPGTQSSAVQESRSLSFIAKSSIAPSTTQTGLDKNKASNTSSHNSSWTIALSIVIPIGSVGFFVLTGWLYVTNYKKISKVIPTIEEGGMSENSKGIVSLKYIPEND